MPKINERIPVYFAGRKPGRGRADDSVSREQADGLVLLEFAKWVNGKKNSLQMLRKEYEIPRPEPSCTMGPRVMEAVAMGKQWAVDILRGWTPP